MKMTRSLTLKKEPTTIRRKYKKTQREIIQAMMHIENKQFPLHQRDDGHTLLNYKAEVTMHGTQNKIA